MLEKRSIKLSSRAQKDFKKLKTEMKDRIKASLNELEYDREKLDIKKLKGVHGREDLYRIRVGDYRIVYFPTDDEILVIRIDKRSKVYKFLD